MEFPVLDDIEHQTRFGFMVWKVYRKLHEGRLLNHDTPEDLKVSGLAPIWRIREASIRTCLNWLVEHDYMIEHERRTQSRRDVRRFTWGPRVPRPTHADRVFLPNRSNATAA